MLSTSTQIRSNFRVRNATSCGVSPKLSGAIALTSTSHHSRVRAWLKSGASNFVVRHDVEADIDDGHVGLPGRQSPARIGAQRICGVQMVAGFRFRLAAKVAAQSHEGLEIIFIKANRSFDIDQGMGPG
jgi:hypothetical protein